MYNIEKFIIAVFCCIIEFAFRGFALSLRDSKVITIAIAIVTQRSPRWIA
ncbi:MAG: hypothetical protein ACRDEA_08410 [Microcystaceae cyanobacterium]